jgi:hypothetical protein
MYGIMMIERFQARGFGVSKTALSRSSRSISRNRVRIVLLILLLLLRRLSGLVLKLLDRLLRVVLVAAVGLDLCYKLALAKVALSLSFA